MQATLSHYRILDQIGAGGMGVVYRAHDERLDRDVALKVLPSGALTDEVARKRFRKEALALSKLNHPNIVVVHDFDTQDGTDFLVQELIEGMSLDEMLVSGPLPEKDLPAITSGLAELKKNSLPSRAISFTRLLEVRQLDGKQSNLNHDLKAWLKSYNVLGSPIFPSSELPRIVQEAGPPLFDRLFPTE